MSFALLTVRTADEDDGALFPVPAEDGTVALEPLDGAPQRLVAGQLHVQELVSGGFKSVVKVPDIKADVLVTDYSSVMFVFAVTRKPMAFFTYDLEHYRDEVRGFYFDFAAEAPGPLVTTADELAAVLRDVDGLRRRYETAYERFSARFCALEDGWAAARVVDAVFGAD